MPGPQPPAGRVAGAQPDLAPCGGAVHLEGVRAGEREDGGAAARHQTTRDGRQERPDEPVLGSGRELQLDRGLAREALDPAKDETGGGVPSWWPCWSGPKAIPSVTRTEPPGTSWAVSRIIVPST